MSTDAEIAALVGSCLHDPVRFVRLAYPWGSGVLTGHPGPDRWQTAFLERWGAAMRARRFDGQTGVAPVRMCVSSGHGIGKSAMVAWVVNYLMATRPHAVGTITANTFTQLETKTWAAIQRWTSLSLTRDWFTTTSTQQYHPTHRASYACSPQSCREENSEAFAGQHNVNSTSFYIFDEASAIPDKIFEVAEGGLTDGEPMIFLFGNPTRSTGRFYRAAFGSERDRWDTVIVDSRESRFTNKAQIAEWVQDYGEDSDFVRVRVRGLPPAASDAQFIDAARVRGAQMREPTVLGEEPLIAGLDVARGGADDCVIRFRRGTDAVSMPPIRIPGEQARDSMHLISVTTEMLRERRPQILFVDETGIGGPIVDRLKQLGHGNVIGVQFGGSSPSPQHANMRAHMWGQMKDWLVRGSIGKDPRLEMDLTGPAYFHDKQDRLVLEAKEHMKARGVGSPDDGDALALTFAQAVRVARRPPPVQLPSSWQAM